MSKSWDDLMARLALLEQRVEMQRPQDYPPMSRKRDQDIEAAVERSNTFWLPCRLGTIVYRQPVLSLSTFSFDASYDAGGEDIAITLVPSTQTVIIPVTSDGSTIIAPQYDALTAKMQAFVPATGAEVAGATGLASFADLPALHVGLARSDREAYRAVMREDLLAAELRVAADLNASSSNYWTFTLRRRRGGQTSGEKLGSRATSVVGLSSQDGVKMCDDPPVVLQEDDFLVLYVSATGTPGPLEDAVLWLKLRRRAL